MLAERPTLRASRKQRAAPSNELLCETVFRPAAHAVVRVLAPLRVPPPAVVLACTATGAVAALLVVWRHLLAAALLLQLKTVLDNADGQLARATGRVSAFGRYLDSESDLLVDAALFAALGEVTGRPLLAALAFCALTIVLSVDYNLERLYRRELGEPPEQLHPATGVTALVARAYAIVYAPQDRAIERLVDRRLHGLPERARRAWHDRFTLTVLANFGLSTQLAALGICLAIGRPAAYLWIAVGCFAALVPLLSYREWLTRQARCVV